MPEPMITYQLCDDDFNTIEYVRMIIGLGASMRNARDYFLRKGYRGKFYIYDTYKHKFQRVHLK